MTFNEFVDYAVSRNCSDMHITAGTNLAVRCNGELEILDIVPTVAEAEEMIFSIMTDKEIEFLKRGNDIDIGIMLDNGMRVRGNVYHQRNNIAASIRLLMQSIPSFAELGLPYVIKDIAEATHGLLLVTGPTGSGKSTTLASIVDYINKTAHKHVITIEDPIEYVYKHDQAMIHQREIGHDVANFASALRSALREDPDIILVGEIRDYATIQAAITAAETGHLVLSTLHTNSAAQTVERIIGSCPQDAQEQVRSQFANCISGVISQQLLPLSDGTGRTLATEVMVGTAAIQNLIRENKIPQINGSIMSGRKDGMHTLNEDLIRLVREGKISRRVAMAASYDTAEFGMNAGTAGTAFDDLI